MPDGAWSFETLRVSPVTTQVRGTSKTDWARTPSAMLDGTHEQNRSPKIELTHTELTFRSLRDVPSETSNQQGQEKVEIHSCRTAFDDIAYRDNGHRGRSIYETDYPVACIWSASRMQGLTMDISSACQLVEQIGVAVEAVCLAVLVKAGLSDDVALV